MSGLTYEGLPSQERAPRSSAPHQPWPGQKPNDEKIAHIQRQSSWRPGGASPQTPQNMVQSPQMQPSSQNQGHNVAWSLRDEPANGMSEEEKARWHRQRKQSYMVSQQQSVLPSTGLGQQPNMTQGTQTSQLTTPQKNVTLYVRGPNSESATDSILRDSAANYVNTEAGRLIETGGTKPLGNTYATDRVLHPAVQERTVLCICKDGGGQLLSKAESMLCIPPGYRGKSRGTGHGRGPQAGILRRGRGRGRGM